MKKQKLNLHGVILLDKPAGLSSNQVLQRVKWLLSARKAGHTGSLDPIATGLLPLCFGQATKVSEYLLNSHKKYTTVLQLGQVTDTLDSEGEITETRPVGVSDEQLEQALEQFRGDIAQVPPMYSALKKDGQPLYKRARKGEVIDRPARDMTVYKLEAKRLPNDQLELNVHCSSGFYIRSLGHDLGQVLGCGAHVIKLRRTDIKRLNVDHAHSLEQIEHFVETDRVTELLLPIDSLIRHMPKLTISDAQALSMLQGRVTSADGAQTNELTRFYRTDGRIFGVGEVSEEGAIKAQKTFVID